MAKQSIDLHELFQYVLLEVHAAWRYRWHALILSWCVLVVGALLVFSLPNQYEADAQVYADTDALTNPLLHGLAVQPDVRMRLRVITQTMLSRPNLETVADKTGLALRATTPADKDALLVKLGTAVKVKGADTDSKNLYNISYTDPDPKMAQKVVQAFLQILMNDTLGANSASTESAQTFLQQQVVDYSDRLNDAEKKLAEFKKANIGYLPGPGGGDYTARLQAAESKLQELQGEYDAVIAGRTPVSRLTAPRTREIDQQIASYQQQLDKLLLSYTDEYPDVVTTRRMIAQLKAQRAELLKHPGKAMNTSVADSSGEGARASGYDYRMDPRMLAAQIATQKQQIADLRKNADKITDTQVKLLQLSRNYDITKKQYDELVSRLNKAQMSEDATRTGNNLKFRVISPPIVPLLPTGPHRALLLLVVFLMALGIGGAFAYFLHKIKPVFISLKSLRELEAYPVIGSLSLIESPTRRNEKRREVIGFSAGVGLLAVVLMLGLAFNGPLASLMQHVFVMGAI